MTFSDAKAQPVFWLLGGIFFLASLGFGGFIVHFVGMLVEAGVSPKDAALTSGLIGVSVVVFRLLAGLLVDRVFAPWVGAVAFAASAIGCALITYLPAQAAIGAVLIGAAMGAEVDLVSYLVVRYFGLRHYGAIYGAQYASFLIGTGLSPMIMGFAADYYGSFRPIQLAAITCLVLAALAMLLLPRFPATPQSLS